MCYNNWQRRNSMGRNKPEANFSDDSVNYKNGVSDYMQYSIFSRKWDIH